MDSVSLVAIVAPMLSPEILAALPVWLVAFLLSLTCHEAGHALVGKWGGDPTAENQVTLNPLPHVQRSPMGTIVVPIVSFFMMKGAWMIGWASAPYNPQWALRYPKRAAYMAAAGPAANFLLVLVAAMAMLISVKSGFLAPTSVNLGIANLVVSAQSGDPTAMSMFFSVLFSLNVILGTFNLLPVPPLDGHAIVPLFLPEAGRTMWRRLFNFPSAGMIGLLVAWLLFGAVVGPVLRLSVAALRAVLV